MTTKPMIKWLIGLVAIVVLLTAIIILRSRVGSDVTNKQISAAELAAADGKNGAKCWVAVDGNVYDLSDSLNWENGEHTTSEGQARCGADMSAVIDKAPHGRKMLDQLDVVGQLAK